MALVTLPSAETRNLTAKIRAQASIARLLSEQHRPYQSQGEGPCAGHQCRHGQPDQSGFSCFGTLSSFNESANFIHAKADLKVQQDTSYPTRTNKYKD